MNKLILLLLALLFVTSFLDVGTASKNLVNSGDSMLTSINSNVVNTNSGASGVPVASFRLSTYMTTINNPITLYDTSSGNPSSWSWTVKNNAGTTVFTSTSQNPTWTPSTAGQYSVMLNVSNAYGSSSITKSNKFLIVGSGTAYNSSSDKITWLGDKYNCGTWQMPIGTFYDDPRNVWVDANNKLNLDLKKRDNVWTCGEAQGTSPYCYGIFHWTVESDRLNHVDPNVVMGTFTYQNMPSGQNNELDFEATTWGEATPNRMTYTVQPGSGLGGPSANEHEVAPFVVPSGSQPMVFQVDWQPTRIIFSMFYANGTLCNTWTYSNTAYIPTTAAYNDMMIWATATPTDGLPETLKVDKFQISQSKPITDFYASTTSSSSPFTVQFTDTSTNIPTSYNWNFGDGNTSTSQNPIHMYASPGTYTVTERTSNYYGSNTMTKTSYIIVGNATAGNAPVASFTANPTTGIAPLTVQFTDTSTNTPNSWAWNFGDGTTSTVKNPSHKFTKSGKLKVTLTVTNNAGSSTKYMYVNLVPRQFNYRHNASIASHQHSFS